MAVEASLREELEGARWYQGKSRELTSLVLVDRIELPVSAGGLLVILAAGYADGTAAEYAMPARAGADGVLRGAQDDDSLWAVLAGIAMGGGSLKGAHGVVEGMSTSGPALLAASTRRALEADQSNSSVVLDERVVLKCYRRLRPGRHPEQEVLQGLTDVGSTRAPTLLGGLVYDDNGARTVLATAYTYVAGEPVGWEPAIVSLTTALPGPREELARLAHEAGELGRCVGELHRDLLAAFGERPATREDVRVARARAEAGLEEALSTVGPLAPELVDLEEAARRALNALDQLEGTPLQRIHGDLHVGQLLHGQGGVVVLDFEGDPTLPIEARGRLSSPLRDVASLLLSLDHVAAAAARRCGFGAATASALEWSTAARAAVLTAYADAAPSWTHDRPLLLHAIEVEKEWREALYAARVLPEWLYAPRLVLPGLLA